MLSSTIPAPPRPPYRVMPLTEEQAAALCEWRYEAPFTFYQWLSWADMQAQEREFGDPAIRREQYAAVLDADDAFIGFAQFFPLAGVTRLGLGLRPDLCGRGAGLGFVQAIVREAIRRAPGNEIDLEVHAWNERAIAVYERAGFVVSDHYELATARGSEQILCMVYPDGRVQFPSQ
ncbi:GNAT family N-acetyltransferase [Paenibacillus methanolicus]|uniref:RimJ/RimL family protein N-acetyltransferase n=1 Tax=Paenibacillus methanolicus TaxID=582686 RepID=A0A5S5BSM5_9BACL|nr:GNAT family N-acetyltransferase [Paenibacillus methanolicus]TYP69368.1 RimJ/RimL family protein N-acetyltransferase [Paenibacillus methanolicus]